MLLQFWMHQEYRYLPAKYIIFWGYNHFKAELDSCINIPSPIAHWHELRFRNTMRTFKRGIREICRPKLSEGLGQWNTACFTPNRGFYASIRRGRKTRKRVRSVCTNWQLANTWPWIAWSVAVFSLSNYFSPPVLDSLFLPSTSHEVLSDHKPSQNKPSAYFEAAGWWFWRLHAMLPSLSLHQHTQHPAINHKISWRLNALDAKDAPCQTNNGNTSDTNNEPKYNIRDKKTLIFPFHCLIARRNFVVLS